MSGSNLAMSGPFRAALAGVALLTMATTSPAAARTDANRATPAAKCASLAKLRLPDTSIANATVVDGQAESPVVTDGPYLETKEAMAGFWVIDAPDLDVAIKLAAAASKACRGKVEVRPFDGLA